ncbi:MAG: ATP-binding protein [Thermodesulfobacteriota bacterium]
MQTLDRLIAASPWWQDPDWERTDRSLRQVAATGIHFRHLDLEATRASHLLPGSVSIIRGPRQVGKTTELKMLARDLLAAGVAPRHIAYYSCDDLIHFRELLALVKAFTESLRWSKADGFLLLDGISAVKNWPRAIKALADAGELDTVAVLLTGSSALEIKRGYERMPGRRGAGFDKAFLPMSFADFCKALGTMAPSARLGAVVADEALFRDFQMETSLKKDALARLLDLYLPWGGFPRAVADLARDKTVTTETLDIYRSVVLSEFEKQRRQAPLLLGLLRKLYGVLGSPVSYHGLTQDTGCSTGAVVQDYLAIASAAFLGFEVPCIDLDRRRPYPKRGKKFYAVDPMIWQVTARGAGLAPLATSVLAEQAVATHLIRCRADDWASLGFLEGLYYYRSRKATRLTSYCFRRQTSDPSGWRSSIRAGSPVGTSRASTRESARASWSRPIPTSGARRCAICPCGRFSC